MNVELTKADISLILESFKYSKLNIDNGNAPYEVKKDKLRQVEDVEEKLRAIRDKDK